MKIKKVIKSITIHTNQEKKTYACGNLIIAKIEDWTTEYPDHIHTHFKVFDKNNNTLFDLINLPVEVCYETVCMEDSDG